MTNWLKKLQDYEGAVVERYNPFDHVIRTPSPSVNCTFGNTHGLPMGFSLCLYGPPKGGKTVLCNATIGQLHADDPEAIVIKFDTEMRELGQLTDQTADLWGIDRDRYQAFSTNVPNQIFDRIETEISALCQAGMPLKLVIVDSINGIQGRRAMNATSIDTQQIGDHALTIQEGLKRILPIQRKHRFGLILTAHVRAEMDQLEQRRGNTVKMAAAFGVKHHAEYFMYVEPNRNKEARTDFFGEAFEDESLKDMNDHAERTGHKIRVQMKDSSMGPKLRMGEFTLDYRQGIIHVYEEVARLGINRGVIERPSNVTFQFKDEKWVGKPNFVAAVRDNPELQKAIVDEIRLRDLAGHYSAEDAALGQDQD